MVSAAERTIKKRGIAFVRLLLLFVVIINAVDASNSRSTPSTEDPSPKQSHTQTRTFVAPQPPPPTTTEQAPPSPAANDTNISSSTTTTQSPATPTTSDDGGGCDDSCTALAAGLGGAAACFLILGSALGYYLFKNTDPYAVVDHSYQMSPIMTSVSVMHVPLLVNNDSDVLQLQEIKKTDFDFI
ncbi:membrane-associated protein, putative [Bodo saltans]|uniref:Membrane-associated protein, putative n=1 Tax=Bodo saltans TaxID=75058 RepID=A0A0S4IY15_BODSA|nr:membrane-associated protein, putative [Bodo saltans]|eukprot:CUG50587.1 membrane-associated protein, putative [Bodo saltans]